LYFKAAEEYKRIKEGPKIVIIIIEGAIAQKSSK